MALAKTTVSAAVAQSDAVLNITSATGVAAGMLYILDQEVGQVSKNYSSGTAIPVQRGLDGTAVTTHKASANIVFFLASDQPGPSPQEVTQYPIAGRAKRVASYSASGAITLPAQGEDLIVILNGTGALAMTLAVPTTDMDGCTVTVASNGKAAHTVTASGGFGANTTNSDVMTFNASQTGAFSFIAANGVWCLIGHVAGAATVAGPGLA